MGAGYHGGFGNTKGSQKKKRQEEKKETEKGLIDELVRSGIKISVKDVVFIARDKTNQIVWLEKGNSFVGLEHILQRHSDDFANKHNIAKEDIPGHLKSVFTSGKVEYNRLVERNGKIGYERLFSRNGHYYLQTAIGTNGFVVSAYPIDDKVAKKLIERYAK